MEQVVMWQARDGKVFLSSEACQEHENTLSEKILDQFVLGYDSEGRPCSWISGDAQYAQLIGYPTDEELEDPELDSAWADCFDSDLEKAFSSNGYKPGWYVRDPYSEWWHSWVDYAAEFNRQKDILTGLREKGF